MSVASQTSSATLMAGVIAVGFVVAVVGIRYLLSRIDTLLLGIR
jgi:hypothetical protein